MQGDAAAFLGNFLGQNLGKFGKNLANFVQNSGKIWTNLGKSD